MFRKFCTEMNFYVDIVDLQGEGSDLELLPSKAYALLDLFPGFVEAFTITISSQFA
jgi:hypothetical protein